MTFKRLLHISRPFLWIYTAGAVAVGVGNIHNFNTIVWVELLLFTFPFNFLLYGINDVYDRPTDLLNPRKGKNQGAILKESEVKPVIIISLIFAAAMLTVAALSGRFEHLLAMTIVVLAVFLYSHPIVRFKETPILDGVVGGAGYILPVLVGYTLHGSFAEIPSWIWFFAITMAGAHAVSTLMDIESDRAAGLRTTGVVLGDKLTLLWAMTAFAVGLVGLARHLLLVSIVGAGLTLLFVTYLSIKKGDPNRFWYYFTVSAVFAITWLIILIYYFLLANRANFNMVF